MKLKNRKTGEIKECVVIPIDGNGYPNEYQVFEKGESLAELNEEWEDVPEEPKEYWFIDAFGNIIQNRITKHRGDTYTDMSSDYEMQKRIGNYFGTKEEAEGVVKKLKAWQRLKEKGFEFINFPYKKICKYDARTGVGNLEYQVKYYEELDSDLDLLLSGEDD